MFSNESTEEIILKQERQIKELEIRMEQLQNHVGALYEEVGITPEQLDAAFKKSENFSPEEWEEIDLQKKKIEERVEQERIQLGSKPKERTIPPIQNHWIHVR